MKAKILILGILVAFVTSIAFSQNNLTKNGTLETVGAGVIDFLLSNPKTANRLNATQETALNTLGDVLRIFGERKHQVNVANAGRDQIVINANDGRQITVVMDTRGNMYLLKDGVIYPLAQSLVNQAEDYTSNPLEYVNENSSDFGVAPANNSSIQPPYASSTLPAYDLNYLQNEYSRFQESVENLTALLKVGSTLNVLFTYNWVSNINGDGKFTFNEFNDIKRTFKVGEPVCLAFEFVARCGTNSLGKDIGDNVSFLLQIFNNLNGELIGKKDYFFHNPRGDVRFENKLFLESLGNSFPIGKYLISVSITSSNRLTAYTKTFLKEYFEVIE
jgi:hypothetical protein